MKYQILKYNPAPEAFYFVREDEYRDGHRPIRQWDSIEEAKAAVLGMLRWASENEEHVIVTVHLGISHRKTYPPPEPIVTTREYTLDTIAERDVARAPQDPA